MADSRRTDPAAGPADARMAAYLEGRHHPQHALSPRTAFVAVDADEIIGYVAGHLTHRHDCDAEIQYLFVTPAHRRVGTATHLLRLQLGWLHQRGARKICVNVEPDNVAARALYARLGAVELAPFWMVWNTVHAVATGAALT